MRHLLRWLLYLSCGMAAFLVIALTLGGLWMYASLPETDGEHALPGLSQPVEILRDTEGLVTIRSDSLAEGVFALGYVHAQERLTQMELMRRVGRGRLAEVIGSAGLASDRLMRTLGFGRLSDAAVANLESETRSLLQSYADGVNAFLEHRQTPLPLELALLGIEPEPWRPADSVLWGKMMAIQLSGNWRQELRNARLDTVLEGSQLQTLFPELPADSPATLDAAPMDLSKTRALLLEALPEEVQAYRGASNVWALSGSRSESGFPILANDPHLSLQAPGTWFLARIETPELTLAGATAPGVPLVIIGHNAQAAWGITTTHSDTQDLVVETLDPDNSDAYLTPEGPQPFESREESIPVRFGDDVRLRIRHGRFGPVVSDVQDGDILPTGDQSVLSLAWPILQEGDTTADSLVRLNQATSWTDFEAAMRRFVGPQQNIFYADRKGTIGFYTPGLVPIREGYDGSRPVEGKDRDNIWSGFIPFEELPHARSPEGGQLLNANNRIAGPDYPHNLGTQWPEPYRAERIADLLDQKKRHDLKDMTELQNDHLSLMAQDLLPLMLEFQAANSLQEDTKALLSAWDGQMKRNQAAPLLFQAWLKTLQDSLFAAPLGRYYGELGYWNPRAVKTILGRDRQWCEELAADCSELLRESLKEALALLSVESPSKLEALQWQDRHRTHMAHPLFGRLPLIGELATIDVGTDGGDFTINRGTPSARQTTLFRHVHGPGLRAVFDLSNPDNSLFMTAAGQSGNPLSPLFRNFAEPWRDGRYLKLVAPALEDADRMRLTPETGD